MNMLAQQLDEKLQSLGPAKAKVLESLVRAALKQVEQSEGAGNQEDWPPEYFQSTAGALEGETFERPSQHELPQREDW